MLEQMFFPRKVRRNRCCWLAADIERYLAWLLQQGFSEHLSRDRVPPLVRFGRFTRERGVSFCEQLPDHVDAFVAHEGRRCAARTREERKGRRRRARPAVEQMLRLSVPGFRGGRWLARPWPCAETAPASGAICAMSAGFATPRSGRTRITCASWRRSWPRSASGSAI